MRRSFGAARGEQPLTPFRGLRDLLEQFLPGHGHALSGVTRADGGDDVRDRNGWALDDKFDDVGEYGPPVCGFHDWGLSFSRSKSRRADAGIAEQGCRLIA
jgi:hypothetical protein